MPVASLLLRKQLKTTRLPFLVNCFQQFDQFYGMRTSCSSDRLWLCLWHRRTPADFSFALLSVSGSDDELSLEASVYVFSFSFSEESSVEMS